MAYNNVKVKARQTVTQSSTQTKDLGTVSEVPMGEWNSETPYKKLNKVRYVSTVGSGVTLLAKKANQGVEPFVSQGWQEVWMVENYDGLVTPVGTYPDMTVGNATNAQNDSTGANIAEHFGDIEKLIPSTASAQNQLADKAFVNSTVNNMSAFYITYTQGSATEMGQAFPTQASLLNATTFYSGTQVRVPTQNDYATVLADETQPKGVDGSYPTTRYVYQTNEVGGTYPNGQWAFQYIVNNTSLTQAQVDAINSGITKEIVDTIGKGTVTGVKGNSESTYKTGNVNLTPENIGAINKSGDTMQGAFNLANDTWNLSGDDAYFGDNNQGGAFCIKGANGTTVLCMVQHDDDNNRAKISFDGTKVDIDKAIYENSQRVYSPNNPPSGLEAYPVGAIYISINSTDPGRLFGGSWTKIQSGYYLKAVTSGAGSYGSAGLPNIVGTWQRGTDTENTITNDRASNPLVGAFYEAGSVGSRRAMGNSSGNYNGATRLGFDASRSNGIYGNSTTVTPLNYSVYMWRRTA